MASLLALIADDVKYCVDAQGVLSSSADALASLCGARTAGRSTWAAAAVRTLCRRGAGAACVHGAGGMRRARGPWRAVACTVGGAGACAETREIPRRRHGRI